MIRVLLLTLFFVFYMQDHSFAATSKSKSIPQETKQKQTVAKRYEPAANVKRIYFRAFGEAHSAAPGESVEIKYRTGCGYTHQSMLKFDVFRLKENPTSYAFRISGQVDTESCMNTKMVSILYEMLDSSIHVTEINSKDQKIEITAIHPSIIFEPKNNLIADNEGKVYLQHKNSLYYKKNENGDEWSRIVENIKAFAIDGTNNKIIYIIKTDDSVQKSMDGGQKWLTIESGLSKELKFNDIFLNPYNSQEVFLLSDLSLYRTTDAGFSWESASTELEMVPMQLLVHPKEEKTYYGLFFDYTVGFWKPMISKDAGLTWADMSNTLPKRVVKGAGRTAVKEPIIVKSIALSNLDAPSLLALTDDNGILITTDNGMTWNEINNGFNKEDGAYSIRTSKSGVYIGSYGSIYFLKNGTDKWTKIGLEKSPEPVTAITGIYPLPGEDQFIITDLDRIHYVNQQGDLIGLNYGVMPHSNILYVKNLISEGKNRTFALVKNNNFTDIGDNYGLFVSDNNGKTWRKSLIYDAPYGGDYDPKIFQSPHNEKEIWYYGRTGNFWFTLDGGTTWNEYRVWPFTNNQMHCFVFDPIDPKTKYACAGGSLFVNKNSSQTWTEINSNAKNMLISVYEGKKTLLTDKFEFSLDGGWTWNRMPPLKNSNWCDQTYKCSLVSFSSDEVLFLLEDGLSFSNNKGNTWENLLIAKDSKEDLYLLHVNLLEPKNIFILIDDRSYKSTVKTISVHESVDNGRTWKQIYSYPLTKDNDWDLITSVAVANDEGRRAIYLGTKKGLLKSIDGGINWKRLGGIQ